MPKEMTISFFFSSHFHLFSFLHFPSFISVVSFLCSPPSSVQWLFFFFSPFYHGPATHQTTWASRHLLLTSFVFHTRLLLVTDLHNVLEWPNGARTATAVPIATLQINTLKYQLKHQHETDCNWEPKESLLNIMLFWSQYCDVWYWWTNWTTHDEW